MPHDLLLTPAPPETCPSCTAYERLALQLLAERALGPSSTWWPYIATLPPRVNAALNMLPGDLQDLEGTYAGTHVAAARRRLHRLTVKAATNAGPTAARYSRDALQWALAIVLSRAFTVGRPHPAPSAAVEAATPLYDTPFLAPGADLLNHHPSAKVGWTLYRKHADAEAARRRLAASVSDTPALPRTTNASRGVFSVVTLDYYPRSGMEVFNYYADLSSGALLAHYGFATESNQDDAMIVLLPARIPPPTDLALPAEEPPACHAAAGEGSAPQRQPHSHDANVAITLRARGELPQLLINAGMLAALQSTALLSWLEAHELVAPQPPSPGHGAVSNDSTWNPEDNAQAAWQALIQAIHDMRRQDSLVADEHVPAATAAVDAVGKVTASEASIQRVHASSTAPNSGTGDFQCSANVVGAVLQRRIPGVPPMVQLYAHVLVHDALAELAARYPTNATFDQRELELVQKRVIEWEKACARLARGLKSVESNTGATPEMPRNVHVAGSVAARGSGRAEAAAAAFTRSVEGSRSLTPLGVDASTVRGWRRKMSIFIARVAEQRILERAMVALRARVADMVRAATAAGVRVRGHGKGVLLASADGTLAAVGPDGMLPDRRGSDGHSVGAGKRVLLPDVARPSGDTGFAAAYHPSHADGVSDWEGPHADHRAAGRRDDGSAGAIEHSEMEAAGRGHLRASTLLGGEALLHLYAANEIDGAGGAASHNEHHHHHHHRDADDDASDGDARRDLRGERQLPTPSVAAQQQEQEQEQKQGQEQEQEREQEHVRTENSSPQLLEQDGNGSTRHSDTAPAAQTIVAVPTSTLSASTDAASRGVHIPSDA